MLEPIQKRHSDLIKNKDYLDGVIKSNAEKANYYAAKTLRKFRRGRLSCTRTVSCKGGIKDG